MAVGTCGQREHAWSVPLLLRPAVASFACCLRPPQSWPFLRPTLPSPLIRTPLTPDLRHCMRSHPSFAELYPGLPLWVENVEEFVEAMGGGMLPAEELDRCCGISSSSYSSRNNNSLLLSFLMQLQAAHAAQHALQRLT